MLVRRISPFLLCVLMVFSQTTVTAEDEGVAKHPRERAITMGAWRDLKVFQIQGKRDINDKTQMRNGDKAIAFNGKPLMSNRDLAREMFACFAGDKVTLTVERNFGTKEEPKLEQFDVEITMMGPSRLYGEMAKGTKREYRDLASLHPEWGIDSNDEMESTMLRMLLEAGHDNAYGELKTCFKRMTEDAKGHWLHDEVRWLLNHPTQHERWGRWVTDSVTPKHSPAEILRHCRTLSVPDGSELKWEYFDSKKEEQAESGEKSLTDLALKILQDLDYIQSQYDSAFTSDDDTRQFDSKKLSELFDPLWNGHPDWAEFSELIQASKGYESWDFQKAIALSTQLLSEFTPGSEAFDKLKAMEFKASDFGNNDIVVLGPGDDIFEGSPRVLIDFGGDDIYKLHSPTDDKGNQLSQCIIDLGGDDTYRAKRGCLASGSFSTSFLIDIAGDDTYHCDNNGLGFALFGLGVLYDHAGHDRYEGDEFTTGTAFNGVGLVIDRKGNDRYNAAHFSQGCGLGGGVGGLVDFQGDDVYVCTGKAPSGYGDAGEFSGWGQGVGFGFRYLTGGGIGMLVDHQGKDLYRVGQFGLGCGYWWGVGLVHDRNGGDIYECSRYGLGTGAHYGVGIVLDDKGNDLYTATRKSAVAEMGSCWDMTVSSLIDSAGDDTYRAKSYALGGASQNAFGFFWDKGGNDTYIGNANNGCLGYIGDASYGAGRMAENIGVFLDSEGKDTYSMEGRGNGVSGVNKSYGIFVDVEKEETDSNDGSKD